jgi:hypothetical protein
MPLDAERSLCLWAEGGPRTNAVFAPPVRKRMRHRVASNNPVLMLLLPQLCAKTRSCCTAQVKTCSGSLDDHPDKGQLAKHRLAAN